MMYIYRFKTLEEFMEEARLATGSASNWREHFEFDGKEVWLGREVDIDDFDDILTNGDNYKWTEYFSIWDEVYEEYENSSVDYSRGDMDFMARENHFVKMPLKRVKSFKGIKDGDAFLHRYIDVATLDQVTVMFQIHSIYKHSKSKAYFMYKDEDGELDWTEAEGQDIIKKKLFNKIK